MLERTAFMAATNLSEFGGETWGFVRLPVCLLASGSPGRRYEYARDPPVGQEPEDLTGKPRSEANTEQSGSYRTLVDKRKGLQRQTSAWNSPQSCQGTATSPAAQPAARGG